MKRDSTPAAIEGSSILVMGQNIKPSGYPTKVLGVVMFPVSATRRATGVIIAECNPKAPKIREYSMLDNGDQISGPDLWGLSKHALRKVAVGKSSGRSGGHSGQSATLDGGFCYLEIVEGWRGSALPLHPKENLPSTEVNTGQPQD